MAGLLTPNDEAQLAQTIDMFEVITQSQPQDYQSLEILKEAYVKLGLEKEALNTSKRIAQAHVLMGQISSAILEYESVLQRFPDDQDVLNALEELESRASNLSNESVTDVSSAGKGSARSAAAKAGWTEIRARVSDLDDGREAMHKIFVEGKVIAPATFDECWSRPESDHPVDKPVEPFIQLLADKGFTPIERSLKMLSDKSRLGYLPLEKYDVDVEMARTFPAEVCRRWCMLPFDKLSKCVLVATANPFNRQAAAELEETNKYRLLWYLASPADIVKALKKVFR